MTLHISTLIEELSVLPEQNSAAMQLLSLLNDPDAQARDIAQIIEADPSMTTRLMTLANSAFFAVRSPATNAWAAVMVVGFNVVRALAASGTLGLTSNGSDMPKGFFDHSIASAAGASVVAREAGMRPADAFSAGLLHDVGGALLFRAARSRWQETVVTDGDGYHTSLRAERTVFGAGHDELGAEVLSYLHFPPSIVDIVLRHNEDPDLIEERLTSVVIAGIALAEADGTGSTSQPIDNMAHALETAGISVSKIPELTASLRDEVGELQALLR